MALKILLIIFIPFVILLIIAHYNYILIYLNLNSFIFTHLTKNCKSMKQYKNKKVISEEKVQRKIIDIVRIIKKGQTE